MEKESVGKILPIFLFLVGLSLFLLFGGNLGWIRPIRGAVEKVSLPLKMAVFRAWQGGLGSLGSLGTLGAVKEQTQKIADLEKQSRELSALKVKLEVLEEENKALRKQLEAPLPASMKFLPAKTLGLTRYLTIDKGKEEGVKAGMTVVSENILVGKIVGLTPKTAQIILAKDPDSKTPARTLKTNARGLVIGEFGTKLSLDKVLQTEVLEIDDLVVTTGEGGYAPDLVLGKIAKIEKVAVEPFQKGEITPFLDYQKLINVFVILR